MSIGRGREYSRSVVLSMMVDLLHVDDHIVNVIGGVQDLLLSNFQAIVL